MCLCYCADVSKSSFGFRATFPRLFTYIQRTSLTVRNAHDTWLKTFHPDTPPTTNKTEKKHPPKDDSIFASPTSQSRCKRSFHPTPREAPQRTTVYIVPPEHLGGVCFCGNLLHGVCKKKTRKLIINSLISDLAVVGLYRQVL